jgi:endonuclease/exonuclease/phosphatase family metal-dependent hydrolase
MGRRSSVVGLVLGLASALLVACSDYTGPPELSDAPSTSSGSASAAADPMSLSLLVFNVEYGGSKSTDAVMRDLDADVVGVLESYNRLPEIAQAAGYPYYNVGLQILSKYPILEPAQADGLYSYIEVRPGEAVAMINTHLDYVKDGPNRLANGMPVEEVLASEDEVRTSSVEKLLPSVTTLLEDGWPVFFTGDLNQPSHLDWTAETAAQHGGAGPVAWPVSQLLMEAGMRDAYRETHPDPVTDPGNTWGQVADNGGSPRRIDYAYVGGPVEIQSSELVGEEGADGVDRAYPRWTADHRAVYSELSVTPFPIPPTVALSSRMLTVGDAVTVSYRLPEGITEGVVSVSGEAATSFDLTEESGTFDIGTESMEPGSHQVEMTDAEGEVIAVNEFYVRPEDAQVELATDAPTYGVGDPITVSWTDGPANRWDWIGVYHADADNPHRDDYLVWAYTGGHDAGAIPPSTEGSLVFGRDHQGRPWPLPAGDYTVHYLLTDQYNSAGSAEFTVEDR